MPNISDVPIDWANVEWLYVIVLSVIVFFSTLICTLAFRGAVMSAILFAIAFVFFTYYPHSLPLPTSLKKAPAPVAPAGSPPRIRSRRPARCAKFGDAFMGYLLVKFQRKLGNAGTAYLILPPSGTEPRR